MNKEPHLDSGFCLFRETTDLVSPISVIYYEQYDDIKALEKRLAQDHEKLQCIVGQVEGFSIPIPFGVAQQPGLDDFADNINTLAFLSALH